MKNTLEGQKSFPVLAWSLVILLCVGVYYLAQRLNETADGLDGSKIHIERAVADQNDRTFDFEASR